MTSQTISALPVSRHPPLTFRRLLLAYFLLAAIPYAWSLTQGLEYRGLYVTVITALNIIGFTALLAQYPLSGRIDGVAQFTGIDNGMRLHRRAGEFTALFFFLHPFLIVLPRILVAPQKTTSDLWKVFIAPEAATGLFAWAIMGVWVLVAMNRKKIGMSYEAWRISHGLGFVAVAILGTHHAVTVGRHGRYNAMFDLMWIVICIMAVSVVSYTYFVRPFLLKRRPFKVVSTRKIGTSDWELTIEKDGEFEFDFIAGQFVWINTSGNAFNRTEHPFSIASSPTALPRISFVIRELGDYTSRLGQLRTGSKVYVDGPHGVFTLNGHKAEGIGLIAGGAGIGPIMGILRQLHDLDEQRPVRLVYGNRSFGQMVYQDELEAISASLNNCRQTLVLEQPEPGVAAEDGRISQDILQKIFDESARKSWIFYVCGPPVMVEAVVGSLRKMGISEHRILFEQLAF
jgi:predicted ferric reductase